MSAAVVPIKRLSAGKSRLLPRFARAELESLCLAMLADVVATLQAAPSLSRVFVVTPDADVAAAARAAGADALLQPDPGLNPSIESAVVALGSAASEPLLVLLGDVAGARSEDVEALFGALAEMGGRGVVLAASLDGGTAALLRAPADVIPARFGPDSAARHREAAATAGVPCRELALESLAIDLDCAEDLEHFIAVDTGGPRTRALLRQLLAKAAS